MTDDTTDGGDFAAFEAKATSGEEPPIADDETNTGETVEEVDPPAEINDEADEPEKVEDDEPEAEDKRRRSKPASERIAEITRDKHEAIRRAEAAEARLRELETGEQPQEQVATTELAKPKPSPDDFEFGEADPGYLEALTDWKVDERLAKRDAERVAEAQKAAIIERATALDSSWEEQAAKATERYDDFAETIADYQAKAPCPKLLALAIQASDQGADIAYHLAKNPEENRQLAAIAEQDPLEAARRFGRLEARFETRDAKPEPRRVTNAPEPPRHTTRGSGGKYDVGADTTDFAAFERKANAR